ncbi:MAG: hypothetical protein Q7Q71_14460 [Verrucomicrobiota bacterium JB023]|nr:hypothetical protein [Verrucomicrobiota bacterium JB023]
MSTVKSCLALPLFIAILLHSAIQAEVPAVFRHQGRLAVNGTNFDGKGEFKFLLYHGTSSGSVEEPLWKNDDSSPSEAKEPESAIALILEEGRYEVGLGGVGQSPITANLLPGKNQELFLRIWFNDGQNGFQALEPDRALASVPFARHADLSQNAISELRNDANYLSGDGDVNIGGEFTAAGDIKSAGEFKFTTPQVGKVQLSGFDFVAATSTEPSHKVLIGPVGAVRVTNGESSRYGATVRIPAGAEVTGYTLHLYEDSVDGEGKFRSVNSKLGKRNGGQLDLTPIAAIDVAQNDFAPTFHIPHTLSTDTVTNGLITADECVVLTVILETTNTLDIGILGATVEYQLDTLQP